MQFINIVHTTLKSSLGKKNGYGGDIIPSDTLGATFKSWGEREGHFQIWDMESGLTDYAQFVGPHKPAMSRLFFDFDSSEDIELSKNDAIKLIEKIVELGGDVEKIITRFSGQKGVHVSVPADWFNISHECYDEHANFKAFLVSLKKEYTTLDDGVAGQVHKFRIPGSKHNKSGLYSTRLSFLELKTLTIAEIKARAAIHVTPLDDECLPAVGNKVTKITAWYEDAVSIVRSSEEADLFQNEMSSFATYPDKPCIKALEKAVLPETSRHRGMVVLAAHYLHTKVPDTRALVLVQAFANRQTIDDRRKETEPEGVVKAVYKARIGYQYGCKESLKSDRCSALCPIRDKLKPENAPKITKEKIEAEKEHVKEHPEDKPEPLTKHSGFWYTGPKGGIFPDYEGLLEEYTRRKHYRKFIIPPKASGMSGCFSMLYNGKYWDAVADIQPLATHFVETVMSPKPKNSIKNEFAEKLDDSNVLDGYEKPKEARQFFEESPKNKLNLENGIFDLDTATLLPHSPKYFFNWIISFEYKKDAKCPVFKQFIHDICDGNEATIERLMLFIAYALVDPGYSRHYFMFIIGGGGNGKGTLINFLQEFFGSTYSQAQLSNIVGTFGGAVMEGKLLTTIDELPSSETTSVAWQRIKELTGKGSLKVERKRQDEYRVPATAKLMFVSNHPPVIKDNSDGMKRRALFVLLSKRFTGEGKEDIRLLDKLIAERAGVLNWLLDEWVPKYRASGIPKNSDTDTVEDLLLKGHDPIYAWFEACVTLDPDSGSRYGYKELYDHFHAWATDAENGFRLDDITKYYTQRKVIEFLVVKLGEKCMSRTMSARTITGIKVPGIMGYAPPKPPKEF